MEIQCLPAEHVAYLLAYVVSLPVYLQEYLVVVLVGYFYCLL